MMVEDYPRVSREIDELKQYFADIEVTKYTANTDFTKVDKKSIIYDSYFSSENADGKSHYLAVTFIVTCAGVLDDDFFIKHGFYRNDLVRKNIRNLYVCQYQKILGVPVDYGN